MEHDFESPVELGAGGVELGFAWDLHSPIQIERLRLTPECAGVTLPTIALELAVPVPALRIEPAQLAFADGRGARAAVSVLPRRGARAQLVHVAHPECVGLTRIEERDDGGWSIELEALALAATLHECHGVRVDVRVGDDPQPFSRFVRVEHGSRVTEPDGAQVLGGVFLPGEQVELFGDGRRVTWCLPDRVPCARGLLESFGFQRIARFQAPSEPGAVDARVAAGGSSFRVVGAATDVAFAHADAWVAACKR
jgi:hypothetical protein